MSYNECICTECGFDCATLREENAKFCPQCGTAIPSNQNLANEREKVSDTKETFLCPECKLDCSKISPTNGKVDCPRCGTFVRSISTKAFLYGPTHRDLTKQKIYLCQNCGHDYSRMIQRELGNKCPKCNKPVGYKKSEPNDLKSTEKHHGNTQTKSGFNLLWSINASALGIGFALIQSKLFMDLTAFGLKYDFGYFLGSALIPVIALFAMGGVIGMKFDSRKWGEKSTIWWVCTIAGAILIAFLK